MKLSVAAVILSLAAFAVADLELDKCSWGESYWCSDLRVAKACGAIQHCKTTVWANQKLAQDDTDVCKFCQTIVSDVHAFISEKKTEEDIARFLASACSIIPSQAAANECKQLVTEFVPEIIDLITSELTPQVVCSLLRLCSGLEDTVQHSPIERLLLPEEPALSASVKDSELCNDCKKFMSDIRNWLTSKEYEQQVEKMIDDAVCSRLGSLESECKTLVAAYLPDLLNATAQYYDPNQICQPFCMGLLGSTPAFPDFNTLAYFKALTKAGSVESCMICKTVLGEIQSMARDTKIQNAITHFLKKDICAHTGSYNGTCCAMIDRYAPSVFELIATFMDPNSRCVGFGFCPSSIAVHLEKEKSHVSPECVACKFIIKELDSLLSNNATEADIIAALDKVCSLMPDAIKQQCTDFVNTYGPMIVSLLLEELDPDQICASLGLCTQSDSKPTAVLATPVVHLEREKSHAAVRISPECVLCEFVMQELDSLLGNNATEAEIIAALDKVCSFMPETIKMPCLDFVNTYGPAIIALLKQELDPAQICTFLGMCSQSDGQPAVALAVHATDPEMCLLCETVVQYIEALLDNNATVTDIEAVVKKICNFLPDTMKSQCTALIDEYGSQIVHYIASKYTPQQICTLLKLCPGTKAAETVKMVNLERPVSSRLVGTSQCSYGPSYWCASQKNAEQCGAVDHCKRYVWKN